MDDVTKNGHFWEWLKERGRKQQDEAFKPVHLYIDVPPQQSPNEDSANKRDESGRGVDDCNHVIFQF